MIDLTHTGLTETPNIQIDRLIHCVIPKQCGNMIKVFWIEMQIHLHIITFLCTEFARDVTRPINYIVSTCPGKCRLRKFLSCKTWYLIGLPNIEIIKSQVDALSVSLDQLLIVGFRFGVNSWKCRASKTLFAEISSPFVMIVAYYVFFVNSY